MNITTSDIRNFVISLLASAVVALASLLSSHWLSVGISILVATGFTFLASAGATFLMHFFRNTSERQAELEELSKQLAVIELNDRRQRFVRMIEESIESYRPHKYSDDGNHAWVETDLHALRRFATALNGDAEVRELSQVIRARRENMRNDSGLDVLDAEDPHYDSPDDKRRYLTSLACARDAVAFVRAMDLRGHDIARLVKAISLTEELAP